MKTATTIMVLGLLFCSHVYGQIGGKHAYEFLGLPASSRITALGGTLPAVMDDDVNLALSNPASLNEKMHNRLTFSHNFHFADIQNGYVAFGRSLKGPAINIHAGVQYISYGDFILADQLGTQTGNFSAKETAFVLGASKKVADRISAGINVKGVFSSLESYSSAGIAADAGINYFKDSSSLVVSFTLKNMGAELKTYNGTRFGAPFDVQIGVSKRLRHLPLRISVTGHQLHRLNVRYDDPDARLETDILGEVIKENKFSQAIDNVFRHLIFGGELLLGKNENLRLRASYNHLRRKELSLSTFRSLAGFGLGFGVKINAFRLDYGLGYHHTAGATNHISISTDLGRFVKI